MVGWHAFSPATVERTEVATGPGQQSLQLGPLVGDGHTLRVVLVVVGGEGLLLGQSR